MTSTSFDLAVQRVPSTLAQLPLAFWQNIPASNQPKTAPVQLDVSYQDILCKD